MTQTRWKKAGTLISNTFFVLLIAVTLLLAFFLLQSRLAGGEPCLAGYRLCYVKSGSMEPTLKIGSVILVRPLAEAEIRVGDIITFRGMNSSELVTHRVDRVAAEKKGLLFYTKGDANKVQDTAPVTGQQLLGKVALAVPYLGYVLGYAGTPMGLLILSALALLIIAGGLIRTCTTGKKQRTQDAAGGVTAE